MPGDPLQSALRQLGRSFRAGEVASASDGQLLGRFIDRREPLAFETLLHRHGPMVLGVCRRVLRDPNDAEDAFQATFLVLVRKAAAVARRDAVGPWLYGVAARTARKARTLAARRRFKESLVPPATAVVPDPVADTAELRNVVADEVRALPARYRLPLVFCELEGKDRAEVAQLLGLRPGTLSSRLARGRALLRRRLLRRGLAGAVPAVPAALAERTLAAALECAAAGSAGVAPASVILLTEGVLHAMTLMKWKMLAAAVLAVGLVGGAAVILPGSRPIDGPSLAFDPTPVALAAPPEKPKSPPPTEGHEESSDDTEIQGVWLVLSMDRDGEPLRMPPTNKLRFVFTTDRMYVAANEPMTFANPLTYKLDPGKKPKHIDLKKQTESPKQQWVPWIYSLEGDTLILAGGPEDKPERPAGFSSRSHVLYILRRESRKLPDGAIVADVKNRLAPASLAPLQEAAEATRAAERSLMLIQEDLKQTHAMIQKLEESLARNRALLEQTRQRLDEIAKREAELQKLSTPRQ
jgi:RNA polymerase sigma factor (sigma-70 family)